MRKKYMKSGTTKLAVVILAAGLVCSMAGCASKDAADTTDATDTTDTADTAETTDTAETADTAAETADADTDDSSAAADAEESGEIADFTMADIVEANSRDALLAKYDSIRTQMDGEYVEMTDLYVSKDLCYADNSYGETLVDTNDSWLYYESDGQDYLCYDWFAMSDEEREAGRLKPESYTDPVVDTTSTLTEEIEEVTDNGDGTLTLVTQISAEDIAERLGRDSIVYPDEFYTSPQKNVYTLDKETLEVISCEESVLTDDGEIPFTTITVTHDAEQPEIMQTMLKLIDEFKNDEIENPKTIRLIYDAGTDEEEEYEITVDQKYKVRPYYRTGYDYVYNDPDKKEVYTGGNGSDVTMYAFDNDQTE